MEKWETVFLKNKNLEFTPDKCCGAIVGLNSLLCKLQIILDAAQVSDLRKSIGAIAK